MVVLCVNGERKITTGLLMRAVACLRQTWLPNTISYVINTVVGEEVEEDLLGRFR